MTNSTIASVRVDVVSDVVCPWCYIGKRRLEAALALVPDIPVDINWRPYFLNPWIPREGIDRLTYLETKFGSPERYAVIAERVAAAAAIEGLGYAPDKISPATEHAGLSPPDPVVAQRDRSRQHEAAADGALFLRRRRSDRPEDAHSGRHRLRHGRRPGTPAARQRRRRRPRRDRRQRAQEKPASTAFPASSSAAASSSPARSLRNTSPTPSSAPPAATPADAGVSTAAPHPRERGNQLVHRNPANPFPETN